MNTKIVQFNAVNTTRLEAVDITFNESGTTIIGGSNGQGKTSVLNVIMSLIKGAKHIPKDPVRDGADKGEAKITLNNGVIIRRVFKDGRTTLKVEGCSGSQQKFLNELFGEQALDVREFMLADERDKAKALMSLCGLDFTEVDAEHERLFEDRKAFNREEKRLKSVVDALPQYEDVPEEEVNTVQLIETSTGLQQEVIDLTRSLAGYEDEATRHKENSSRLTTEVAAMKSRIAIMESTSDQSDKTAIAALDRMESVKKQIEVGDRAARIEEINTQIAGAQETNSKVRANKEFVRAFQQHKDATGQAATADEDLKANRERKTAMLEGAKMPVKGLSIDDGAITFKDRRWSSMSTAEQFMVGTAIQAALKPDAPIVLLDHMESFDSVNLKKFSDWCERKGFQVIGTRVSTGSECDIVIEEGNIKETA